jgi:hypothetical protein
MILVSPYHIIPYSFTNKILKNGKRYAIDYLEEKNNLGNIKILIMIPMDLGDLFLGMLLVSLLISLIPLQHRQGKFAYSLQENVGL